MRWSWGDPHPITCPSDDTPSEVAEVHGFTAPEDCIAIFICNGRILCPNLTLQANGVKPGDTIYVHTKEVKQKEPRHVSLIRTEASQRQSQMIRHQMQEAGRLADLAFAAWEVMPDFPKMLNMALRQHQAMLDGIELYEGPPTVIKEATSISDQPLPCLLAM